MTITEIVAKKLRLFSKRRVVNILDGNYDSVFKGKGLEFNSLRKYDIGDEVKDIDWRASARSKDTQTRLYSPLRDQKILVIADTSRSMLIDSYNGLNKRDALYGVVTTLGMFVVKNKDLLAICSSQPDGKIEMTRFSNTLNKLESFLRSLDDSIQKTPNNNQKSLNDLIIYSLGRLKQRSAVFIVSDSIQEPVELKKHLLKLAIKHQVFYIQITPSWPFTNKLEEDIKLVDIEFNGSIEADVAINNQLKKEWEEYYKQNLKDIRQICKSSGVPFESIDKAEEIPSKMLKLFNQARYYARKH